MPGVLVAFLFGAALTGQTWSVGVSVERGLNFSDQYAAVGNASSSTAFAVENRYGIGGILAYDLGERLTVGAYPTLLLQYMTLTTTPSSGFIGRMERIYHRTLLVPLRMDLTFGDQRYRPGFSVAAGFLVDLDRELYTSGLVVEPLLPYVEVGAGVVRQIGGHRFRPEIRVRESLGPFLRSSSVDNAISPRWRHISLGLTVIL